MLLTILSKVFVMMLLIAVGYILRRKAMLTEHGMSEFTNLLLWAVTPCLIISAFLNPAGEIGLKDMGLSVALSAASMLISIFVSLFAFRHEEEARKTVLRYSVVFGNMGFMGLPMAQAIVGDGSIVYASFGIVVFNVICWTYGYRMMNRDAKFKLKMILLNPGMIGVIIGLPLYFLDFTLPAVISEPINLLASVNTPIAMIVIGGYIGGVDIKSFISDFSIYKMSFLRLIISPLLCLGLLLLIRPENDLFLTIIIQACMPVAANAVMFSVQFKKDYALASKAVAVSTLFSILTIPLFTLLSQWLLRVLV